MVDGPPSTQDEIETLRTAALQPGAVVGSYRLVRQIGEGAAGRVFEVEHVKIGRRAAMKILSAEHAARPSAVRRLLSEAQAVNRINHPHIVEITDVFDGEGPARLSGVVMELLEGQSLAQLMVAEGQIPPDRFVSIIAQVADALAAAHAAGFVHRDLKPENIFLIDRDGRRDYVKLLDFGIAKSLAPDPTLQPAGSAPGRQHVTVEGTFLGTPAYASPEQASGKPVDHRTDIYSVGVILYELTCGRLPFEGRNMGEFLVKHITLAPPPAPPEVLAHPVGAALDRIAQRCLEKDPANRFRSAGEIRELLEKIGAGDIPAAALVARRAVPRWWLLAGGGALALALVLTMVLSRRGAPPAPAALTAESARAPTIQPLAPPPQQNISLSFHSDPPEAEVRRVGDPELLGITPFVQAFPVTEGTVEFELRKRGYEPAVHRVTMTADAQVGGPLRKLTRSRSRTGVPSVTPRPRKVGVDKESTLNPFGP